MQKEFLFIIALIVALVPVAYAHEELENPGVLPDSPFYGLKTAGEKVGDFFVLKKVAKAERHLRLAEKRLAEAQALAEKENTEKLNDILQEAQKHIEKANEIAELAQLIRENKEKVAELVALATSKHLRVLEDVKEKAPEQAKTHIENAMEHSRQGYKKALKNLAKHNAKRTAEVAKEALKKELDNAAEEGKELKESNFDDLLEAAEEVAEENENVSEAIAEELETIESPEFLNKTIVKMARVHAIEKQREIIKKLAEKNLIKAVEVHQRLLEKKLTKLSEKSNKGLELDDALQEIEDENNTSEELEEKTKEMGLEDVRQRIAIATQKRIDVLSGLLNKVPPKAGERLEKNIKRMEKMREKLLQHLEEKEEKMKERQEKKDRKLCEQDSDCVRATCCHPTQTVNKDYALNCTTVPCTAVCLGPLDCNAGEPACIKNKCSIRKLESS